MEYNKILNALEEGKMIKKDHWDEGTFIYKEIPLSIRLGQDIYRIKSLPRDVLLEFFRRLNEKNIEKTLSNTINYKNHINIVSKNNDICPYILNDFDINTENWTIIS